LPAYARETLLSWFEKRTVPANGQRPKVALFADTYITHYDTHVGKAAVELLESCGYEVVLVHPGCCQRPRISHGLLREAKKKGMKTIQGLDEYIQRGMKVVVCEPGCASALTDDWPDMIEDDDLAARIKENVMTIDVFLATEIAEGRLDCGFSSPYQRILIHGHCHQKALYGTFGMKTILDRVEGLSASEIDSGCCGMAGSFGYEKEHYDISKTIGEDRLFPAIRNRPENAEVVACGFSCRHQIEDFTGARPLHWVETVRGTAKG
jgi:Fe-S oxidoreductase